MLGRKDGGMKAMKIATSIDELPDLEELTSVSGLTFMQEVVAGTRAIPPIAATLGFRPTLAEEGRVIFEGVPAFNSTNPMGGLHGGWYGAILDSALGCAVMTKVPKGSFYTTLEYKINITRSIPLGTEVTAIGQVSHAGRSTAVAWGEIRGKDDDRLYATGSTTCIIMQA